MFDKQGVDLRRDGLLRVFNRAAAREREERTGGTERCAIDTSEPGSCLDLTQVIEKKTTKNRNVTFDELTSSIRSKREHVERFDARWSSFAPLAIVAQTRRFL